MSGERLRQIAAAGLVIGAVLGMSGSFTPSVQLRGLAWGVDGIAIVIASALLVVHHGREGNDELAAGFRAVGRHRGSPRPDRFRRMAPALEGSNLILRSVTSQPRSIRATETVSKAGRHRMAQWPMVNR